MEFAKTEIIFYAIAFVVAGASCLARVWRDNESAGARAVVGRCISAGFFGAGGIALLIGRYPDSIAAGAFYHLAIAAFIGYCSKDIQDQVLTRVAKWITKRLGPDDEQRPGEEPRGPASA